VTILLAAPIAICHLLSVIRSGDGLPDRPYQFKIGPEVISSRGSVTGSVLGAPFTLPVDSAQIDRLYSIECQRSTVYLYELNDRESGWSVVVGVEGSGKIAYRTELGGFKLAPPAVERSSAYVATIGYIAKVDLTNGKIVWSHKDLMTHDSAFNVFDVPVVGRSDVVFRAKVSPESSGFAEALVDKVTGNIKRFSHGG